MDLSEISDEELESQLIAVLAEQERRRDLESIPQQIVELAEKFIAGGGDRGDLVF